MTASALQLCDRGHAWTIIRAQTISRKFRLNEKDVITADTTEAPAEHNAPGKYFGVPLPIWVIVFLAGGLAAGVLFPANRVANAIYTIGTYFPKAVVSFATLIVFAILSGATAKLVLFHQQKAGRVFGLIVLAYVALAFASLVYVTIWIPILTGLPLTAPGSSCALPWRAGAGQATHAGVRSGLTPCMPWGGMVQTPRASRQRGTEVQLRGEVCPRSRWRAELSCACFSWKMM